MEYWCHICKRETNINADTVTCSQCGSNFVELLEDEDQHPRHFVPYQPAQSIRNILSSLLLSSFRSGNETDASMDQIIHHLMMNDTNRYGPPPASLGVVSQLPSVTIDEEVIRTRGRLMSGFDECGDRIDEDRVILECSVCKEEFGVEEHALDMPCQHMFHQDCLVP